MLQILAHFQQQETLQFLVFHRAVTEGYALVGRGTHEDLDPLTMKATRSFETSAATYPATKTGIIRNRRNLCLD